MERPSLVTAGTMRVMLVFMVLVLSWFGTHRCVLGKAGYGTLLSLKMKIGIL